MFVLATWKFSVAAQDVLVMTDGSEQHVKVTEIDGNDIFYVQGGQSGPVSKIHSSKVFMVIYMDGTRETFKAQEEYFTKPVAEKRSDPEGKGATTFHLSRGLFMVNLVSYVGRNDFKKNGFVVNAAVDVYYAGRLFSSVSVSSYQRSDKDFDYKKPNARYWRNNWVTVSAQSEKISHILFEKYENVLGKGFGWVIPPDFFSKSTGVCTIAFLDQNPTSKEVVGFGRISHVKLNLHDCSSPEQRLLSVVMLWLDVNFSKTGKM